MDAQIASPGGSDPGERQISTRNTGPYRTRRQSVAHAATGHSVLWMATRAGSSPATTTPYLSAALHAEEHTTKAATKQIVRDATGGAA